jgi:hypothetical protein
MSTPDQFLSEKRVTRFNCTDGGNQWCQGCYQMEADQDGDYVRWEDYERLQQLVQKWTGDGHLQTFEDRERFRTEAKAIVGQVPA